MKQSLTYNKTMRNQSQAKSHNVISFPLLLSRTVAELALVVGALVLIGDCLVWVRATDYTAATQAGAVAITYVINAAYINERV